MKQEYTFIQKALAYSVHVFTSSGIVAGFLAIIAIDEGRFKEAMLWLFVTLIIDGIDGTFARLFRVQEVLPNFSGKTIDYVIDFATYSIIPTYFIYSAQVDGVYLLPENLRLLGAAIILLVSAMYYGKEGMVSNDYYFIGFPVMWNLMAFYLFFVFTFSPMLNFIMVVIFAILHFIPIKFLYPSRTVKFRWLNLMMTAISIVSSIIILWVYPQKYIELNYVAIVAMLFFGWMAVYHTYLDADTKNI